ncbi:MAG: galactose-1-phosphate uridylyltransferase [Candidatus Bipolaricaulia bacterium]
MPELRRDPITDWWVIIAKERSKRPSDFASHEEHHLNEAESCAFCEGHGGMTPKEIYAIREDGSKPNTPGWQVRVVPNKYPALIIEGDMNRTGIGILDMMNGVGAHEVIIETPCHNCDLTDLSIDHIVKVLKTYSVRIKDLHEDDRFRYVLVFRNYGRSAGASLSHPHSQLIATPVTPNLMRTKLRIARDHYHQKERCIYCDIIQQELEREERIISADEHYVVWSPFAARFPFETHIYPREHSHDFTEDQGEKQYHLARTLKDILLRLQISLNHPGYNFMIHTSPNLTPRLGKPDYWGTIEQDFHWHIEIIPRLTQVAGFEWGTGFYINPTPPEEVANYLQEIDTSEQIEDVVEEA